MCVQVQQSRETPKACRAELNWKTLYREILTDILFFKSIPIHHEVKTRKEHFVPRVPVLYSGHAEQSSGSSHLRCIMVLVRKIDHFLETWPGERGEKKATERL